MKILVVDDHPSVNASITEALKAHPIKSIQSLMVKMHSFILRLEIMIVWSLIS